MADRGETKRKYNFKEIEAKWQKIWNDSQLYKTPELSEGKKKWYQLEMFAYPSGDIHMGHFRNYIIGDAVARQKMMQGYCVLHPFGWDAFGLPAERAAIKRNIHPDDWTKSNIKVSRSTLQKVGILFDWDREIVSCNPEYYKWTQWFFIQLYNKGLAYRKRGFVNWCPEDKTVLANEQVVDGKCERCGTLVEQKDQIQWYFKITDYADRLIDDLDTLPEWPDNLKAMQKEWIGRSHGAEIDFTIEDTGEKLPIFTTRPDTIYGVTFMAISPEAELLDRLNMEPEFVEKVNAYKKKAFARTDIERAALNEDKDGVFTGKYATNPYNGERVQLWVADYVLGGYGTGAVMAVPAHDTRDFAFAKKYDIPIKVVIHPDEKTTLNVDEMDDAFTELGPMVNSDQFNGLKGKDAIEKVTKFAEDKSFGRFKINFKLKDWSLSRQRYWGSPIPIIHCEKCGIVPVPENELPVVLPKVKDFKPKGRSPLADVQEFMNVSCPKCGGEARRDPDTMDTFVCSSWYYLRYIDPNNCGFIFDKETANKWLPVDLYIGGITHATGHLIYFRFFHKFLHDLGLIDSIEPAIRMFNHGMVMDKDGVVMSKSLGNVISPMDVMAKHGVDVSRMAMFFKAPSEKEIDWTNSAIVGSEKFVLNKLVPIIDYYHNSTPNLKYYFKSDELSDYEKSLYIKLNQTIKRVTDDFPRLQFNTSISALMELIRDYEPKKIKNNKFNDYLILKIIQLIAPMVPHLSEEMWQMAGFSDSIFLSEWPIFDTDAVIGDTIEIAVQINGKLRDTITIQADFVQEQVEKIAFDSKKIQNHTKGKNVIKIIFVKGRILNIVVK